MPSNSISECLVWYVTLRTGHDFVFLYIYLTSYLKNHMFSISLLVSSTIHKENPYLSSTISMRYLLFAQRINGISKSMAILTQLSETSVTKKSSLSWIPAHSAATPLSTPAFCKRTSASFPHSMLMYNKEASNRKQEIDRQHYTIPNQRNQKTSIVEKSKLLDFSTILCFVFQNML